MRAILFGTLSFVLSGCAAVAIPPAIEVGSLLLGAGSYITTGKGVGDHVISGVAQKDCAIHRVVTDGDFCYSQDEPVASGPLQREWTPENAASYEPDF